MENKKLTRETQFTTIAVTMRTKAMLDEMRAEMAENLHEDIRLFDGKLSYNQVIGALVTAWRKNFKL